MKCVVCRFLSFEGCAVSNQAVRCPRETSSGTQYKQVHAQTKMAASMMFNKTALL